MSPSTEGSAISGLKLIISTDFKTYERYVLAGVLSTLALTGGYPSVNLPFCDSFSSLCPFASAINYSISSFTLSSTTTSTIAYNPLRPLLSSPIPATTPQQAKAIAPPFSKVTL
ncbi:predicted protein [Sclerotinia sclerotiorum 1980 UF-70]|uniref:Uncharacterized protein n=1 Tax=Sclerotinia sclerotiorum (strain ATCC 18683 / 1980 / Ss-1) TaxID=665079 RepID=A7F5B0_SCLS1|nr:predicted protein [Sclerotinia sclerotiorum 1980 UF-70]EDN97931.1 predicted protein [Sclerotinia sclerotiorum 1980 UF-70]